MVGGFEDRTDGMGGLKPAGRVFVACLGEEPGAGSLSSRLGNVMDAAFRREGVRPRSVSGLVLVVVEVVLRVGLRLGCGVAD